VSAVPHGKGAPPPRNAPYSGYHKRDVPPPDAELTHAGPGTALGEYMRGFWQPVCLSSQLGAVPHPVRILNEDLVVFRDGRGRVGVLHRHCSHRGASLEYGVIQESGIRCCYHGIQYDVDGTILDVPADPDGGAARARRLSQGAYPALERDGLVFAYLGAPEQRPPFPEYDAFEKYGDTRLVPFANVFPCNWLQVLDNIADQAHTSLLHNIPFLYGGKPPEDVDWKSLNLGNFSVTPVMDYVEVRDRTAMCFIASRRIDERKVWFRIQDLILPNKTWHAYLYEDGSERRLFHRVHMTRWYTPVDDTHSIIFGWRMFGRAVDPLQKGREDKLGWDGMDFLGGQVGNRSYYEGQRAPGDWEAVSSQRPIAVHALEHALDSDIGVYTFRKLLREAIRGKNPAAAPAAMNARAHHNEMYPSYTQNNVLLLPRRASEDEDRAMLKQIGREIIRITAEADHLRGAERSATVVRGLEELERRAAA
jgi:phenylpropionate dioxygenase-like ring-hydroxylating dioxygenase large terminal subunit